MTNAIILNSAPHKRAICETKIRYNVYYNGKLFSELYFNMRGYIGHLPCPDGTNLIIGEKPISDYKKEIAKLNREFKNGN